MQTEQMVMIVTVSAEDGEEMPDVLAVADTLTAAVDNAPFALSFDMQIVAGV